MSFWKMGVNAGRIGKDQAKTRDFTKQMSKENRKNIPAKHNPLQGMSHKVHLHKHDNHYRKDDGND